MPPGSDIFASGAEVLVNPVDAATGAQGKGLAKLFAQRFPFAAKSYQRIARRGDMQAGRVWVHDDIGRWIFFAATKRHWRDDAHLRDVSICAMAIRRLVISLMPHGAASIAIPALGCGEGRLAWDDVCQVLEIEARAMARAGIRVMLHEPHERGGQ